MGWIEHHLDKLLTFARFTQDLANLSKCKHGHNAAIIVCRDMLQVLSIGVNGGCSGADTCLCDYNDKYAGCIHAEINALIKCRQSTNDALLFTTKCPCVNCAAAIVNAGISFVFYSAPRECCDAGLQLLQSQHVKVYNINDLIGDTDNGS